MAAPLPDAALDQLFREAHTAYAYTAEPVSEAMLRALWSLASLGPTSANSQPARIVWCTSAEAKDKLAAHVSETNAGKVRGAPVVAIVAMADDFYEVLPRTFPHADARAWFVGNDALIEETAFRNSSLQGAYLIVAARALGLDCGPMSGIDRAGIDRAFFDGTTSRTNFVMTLGHGERAKGHARQPRLDFDEATRVA